MSLVPAGFEQQGAINWDNLALRSVTLSMDILSRCTAAGVDPGTLVLGQLISRNFALSVTGEQNIENALASLPLRSSYDKVLWFGFGIKSLPRILGTSSEGCSLFALCSTLAECFHEGFGAEVLHKLMACTKAPAEYSPSIQQWLMVVRACNGALSMTNFPVIADGFIRLQGLQGKADTFLHRSQCPTPDAMAEALDGIGEVVSGAVDSIHIVGCAAVGWLAAFVDWLFDVRLSVQDHEGNIWYSKFPKGENAQIIIQFDTGGPTQSLHLASKTCLLKDAATFLGSMRGDSIVSGRVPWESCVEAVFGVDFIEMMKSHAELVGKCFGMVAVLLYDPGSMYFRRRHPWLKSHMLGRSPTDFIATLFRYFPELRPTVEYAQLPSLSDWDDTAIRWRELLNKIQLACKCIKCKAETEGRPNVGAPVGPMCFLKTLSTLVQCNAALLCVDFPTTLLPSRMGLRSVLDTANNLSLRKLDKANDESMRIQTWLAIFAGRPFRRDNESILSATQYGGVCLYRQVLQKPSETDGGLEEEPMANFFAVPGQIEYRNRPYVSIQDAGSELPFPDLQALNKFRALPWNGYLTVALEEKARGLFTKYTLESRSAREEQMQPRLEFKPHSLDERLHSKSPGGLTFLNIACGREEVGHLDLHELPQIEEISGSSFAIRTGGMKVQLFTYHEISYMQLAVFTLLSTQWDSDLYYLVDTTCLFCCIANALNYIPQHNRDHPQLNVLGRPWQDVDVEKIPNLVLLVRAADKERWEEQLRRLAALHTMQGTIEG